MCSCTCCVSHGLSCSFADTDQPLMAVGISSCFGCTQRYNSKSFNIRGSCGISLLLDLKINSCFEMQIPMCTKDLWKREYPFFRWFRWGAVFIQRLGDFLWWNCHHLWCRLFNCETFGIKNNVKLKILHYYCTHGIWIIDKKKVLVKRCTRVLTYRGWSVQSERPCNRYWSDYWRFHPLAEPLTAIRLFNGTQEHLNFMWQQFQMSSEWHHDVLIVLIRRVPDQIWKKSNKACKCVRELLTVATAMSRCRSISASCSHRVN